MTFKVKTKTKGFSYKKYYQKFFRTPIKVEKVAENQETGETFALISSKGNYFIQYTDEDIGVYGKDKAEAEKHFKEISR